VSARDIGTETEPIAAPRTDATAHDLDFGPEPRYHRTAPIELPDDHALSPSKGETPADALPHNRQSLTGPIKIAPKQRDWRRRYARFLAISDALVLIWVVFGTQLAWLGLDADVVTRENSLIGDLAYWIFSSALIVLWMTVLALNDTRSHRVIGNGSQEYKRIFDASFVLFGAIAIVAFLFQIDVARGFLLISLPLGILFLFFERWLWRQWLMVRRAQGQYAARVLLVGSEDSVAQVARELKRSWSAGYAVVGCCVPSGRIAATIEGTDIPIMGSVNAIDRALKVTQADTVVVTSTDDLPPDKVKQISWSLEAGRQHLVLAPSIADIAGPRIHTRPVSGLPLIHVETPRFSKGQRVAKRATDLVLSAVGIVMLSPLLLALAITVKLSSPGEVLFRQTRVGYVGTTFRMLKFRSMVQNAEALLPKLQEHRDAGNEILFKMKNDPRVTRVGAFMRKYSLDELPQLINVLRGEMSLIGPRMITRKELEKFGKWQHNLATVKPGLTGLWQVSGRSDLSYEDRVRLDMYYIRNHSIWLDIQILFRTIPVLLFGRGAY
jgi:exopolysaccharide biosynthesis polyprenyl glycosylphosphotransferase